jgi:lipoprotein-anchoring transpeptidase ErfK/SrfK
MRARGWIAIGVAVAAVPVAGLAIYDATNADRVAPGVRVAGVDVGGVSRAEARERIRGRLAAPAAHPVVVSHGTRRFELSPGTSGVRLDDAATADAAVARSREGNFAGRALRDLFGGEVRAEIAPRMRHSAKAVDHFVGEVAAALDREARDADIDFVAYRIRKTRARTGREVRRGALRRAVAARLASPRRDPFVRAQVQVSERPDRTLAELAERYPRVVTVSRQRKILRLYRGLKLADTYRVAIGKAGNATPAGRYEIQTKETDPVWHAPDAEWAGELAGQTIPAGDPRNPLEARWMGFHDGAGIHGTKDVASLGGAASHGCVRMKVSDVVELFRRVKVGTPVFIA